MSDLDRALTQIVADVQRAVPELDLDASDFVAYVGERVEAGAVVREELDKLVLEDLYLAFGCFAGNERARASFDQKILSNVPRFVARISRSSEFADGIRQELREKLLLPTDAPKIGEYTGRGPLGGWVRVAAIRTALNAQRTANRAATRSGNLVRSSRAVPNVTNDPELDFLKSRYANHVKLALERTLAALPIDARNVLRMHYVDGLTIDQIASVSDVHRSTAARWIADARRTILAETKNRLREELKLTGTEVSSIVALVQSQLELSIRLLVPRD